MSGFLSYPVGLRVTTPSLFQNSLLSYRYWQGYRRSSQKPEDIPYSSTPPNSSDDLANQTSSLFLEDSNHLCQNTRKATLVNKRNYHGISLLSIIGKIVTKIIQSIYRKQNSQEEQAGVLEDRIRCGTVKHQGKVNYTVISISEKSNVCQFSNGLAGVVGDAHGFGVYNYNPRISI